MKQIRVKRTLKDIKKVSVGNHDEPRVGYGRTEDSVPGTEDGREMEKER